MRRATRDAGARHGAVATRNGRARRNLVRALARHCRGATIVVAPEQDDLVVQLRARGIAARSPTSRAEGGSATVSDPPVSTVLVAALDPPVTLRHITDVTGSAWQSVAPGGRMIAALPNPAALPGGSAGGAVNRRRLTRVLRTLGEPRLITEQPYRWLVMSVRKPSPGAPRLKRPRRDRYAATAALCRGSVVELGCGAGDLAAIIAGRGHPVVGVDISARKVAAARAAFPELEFRVGDILSIDLPIEHFDTAVIAEVLEHVDDPTGDAMLERAWKLVRAGGRLIVSVPNEDCVPHRNHIREFDARRLAAQLRRFGRPKALADQPFKWLLMYVRKEP